VVSDASQNVAKFFPPLGLAIIVVLAFSFVVLPVVPRDKRAALVEAVSRTARIKSLASAQRQAPREQSLARLTPELYR